MIILTMQRMVNDLLRFLFIFLITTLPFIYTIYDIVQNSKLPSAYRNDSAVNTYFHNLGTAHYSLFTAMFNMVPFASLEVKERTSLFILHVLFAIMVIILLMNLIIAVFSHSVSKVMSHKDVLLVIRNIGVCWYVETRFMMFMPVLYNRVKKRVFPQHGDRLVLSLTTINCS